MTKLIRAAKPLIVAMLMLLSAVMITSCATPPVVVLPDAKVQKMLKGDSASFDGYLMTSGAIAKLLELAEIGKKCK